MTIIKSRFADVPISDMTITERVFVGLKHDDTVLTDGPTGRSYTGAQIITGVKALAGGLTQKGMAPGKTIALRNIASSFTVFSGLAAQSQRSTRPIPLTK